jgi:ribosomal protein L34E
MAESGKHKGKAVKRPISGKELKGFSKKKAKITECVSCLSELHKLQGVLLAQLNREIR